MKHIFFVFSFFLKCNFYVSFYATHIPILFCHYIFLGTCYNYITFTKINEHNNNLTHKYNIQNHKKQPWKHCSQLKPRGGTGGAWFHAPSPERQHDSGGVDQPFPFLLSPIRMFMVTCNIENTAQTQK